ncbi:MAG: hypothetical protein ACREQF_00880 [Candidatus Binataceae bacterium]
MILILHAFRRELAHFESHLANRRPLDIAGLRGFLAHLQSNATEVAAVATGLGPLRARESASRALDALANVDLIVVAGVAGALAANLKPGDLVLADRVIEIDRDTLAVARAFACAPSQFEAVRRMLSDAHVDFSIGALVSMHHILATADEKRRANQQTGAVAVDMETAAVAAEAAARGLSVVAIRAIIDGVEDELPGAGLHNEHGQIRPLRVAGYLLRHPRDLLKLPRLARNMSRATRALAVALEALAGGLPKT